MPRTVAIRLRRSMIGEKEAARRTLRALGLRRVDQQVVRPDTAVVRGMVARVAHLVEVREGVEA